MRYGVGGGVAPGVVPHPCAFGAEGESAPPFAHGGGGLDGGGGPDHGVGGVDGVGGVGGVESPALPEDSDPGQDDIPSRYRRRDQRTNDRQLTVGNVSLAPWDANL